MDIVVYLNFLYKQLLISQFYNIFFVFYCKSIAKCANIKLNTIISEKNYVKAFRTKMVPCAFQAAYIYCPSFGGAVDISVFSYRKRKQTFRHSELNSYLNQLSYRTLCNSPKG